MHICFDRFEEPVIMEAKDVDLPGHVNSLVRYQLVQVNNKALYSI